MDDETTIIREKEAAKSHAGTMTPDLSGSSEPYREVTALKIEKRPKRKAAVVRISGKPGARSPRRAAGGGKRHAPVVSLKAKSEGRMIPQEMIERIILLRRQLREIQKTLRFGELLVIGMLERGAVVREGVHTVRLAQSLEIE